MSNIFSFLFPLKVTDKIHKKYIDTGIVSDAILRIIAIKVMKRSGLSIQEFEIFAGKTAEVNKIIAEITPE